MKVSYRKKIAVQLSLLLAGIVLLCNGLWRGEADMVLQKAVNLCLEWVGIG